MKASKKEFATSILDVTLRDEYDVSWYSLIEKMAASNLDKTSLTLDDVRAIARSMT